MTKEELSEKRKDKKGRIFRSGEGQRPNKTCFYRYHRNGDKKWCYVYAPTLEELRQKEEAVQRDLLDGIDCVGGEITVAELVDRYINLRRGWKENSMRAYGSAINRIHTDPFGSRMICSVRLSDVIPNDAYVQSTLTKIQQERYLQFIRDHGKDNYYDDIVILLGTGLRVSELYGLTKADIDFGRRCIHIHKQLCRTADKPYFVAPPKTSSGNRSIPMTDTVYMAFRRVLENRGHPKVEMMVDGYSGFLFLDKDGKPKPCAHSIFLIAKLTHNLHTLPVNMRKFMENYEAQPQIRMRHHLKISLIFLRFLMKMHHFRPRISNFQKCIP